MPQYGTLLNEEGFNLPSGRPRSLYPPVEQLCFTRDHRMRGRVYHASIQEWFSDVPDHFSVREEGVESRKEDQMYENQHPYFRPPTPSVFRLWALKRALLRFAVWAGWLKVSRHVLEAVLSYRPLTK